MIILRDICPMCHGSGQSNTAVYTSSTSNPLSIPDKLTPSPCGECLGSGVKVTHIWQPEDFGHVTRLLHPQPPAVGADSRMQQALEEE